MMKALTCFCLGLLILLAPGFAWAGPKRVSVDPVASPTAIALEQLLTAAGKLTLEEQLLLKDTAEALAEGEFVAAPVEPAPPRPNPTLAPYVPHEN